MPLNFTISDEGKKLIKNFEGLRLKSYKCPAGVWTIGYGHTGADVKPNMTITKEEAEKLLDKDLVKFIRNVNNKVKVPLKQEHFDALVSFAFNVGNEAFNSSTLLKLLNQGKYLQAANQFSRWVYAGKNKSEGLIKRRKAEEEMFRICCYMYIMF